MALKSPRAKIVKKVALCFFIVSYRRFVSYQSVPWIFDPVHPLEVIVQTIFGWEQISRCGTQPMPCGNPSRRPPSPP